MTVKNCRHRFFCFFWLVSVVAGYAEPSHAQKSASEATDQLKVVFESQIAPNIAEIRSLIKEGADVNVINKYNVTSLYVAAQNGHHEIVKLLLEAKARVNAAFKDGFTPLLISSHQGHSEAVKALLDAKADVNLANKDGTTPVYFASKNGHLETVKVLLAAKADVNLANRDGISPLFMASFKGHYEIVKRLLEAKANVNATKINDNSTPLFAASHQGHHKIVKLLLESKADVSIAHKDGFTPLYMASQNGHREIAKLLLAAKADVNAAQKNGGTSLSPRWRAAKLHRSCRLFRLSGRLEIRAWCECFGTDNVAFFIYFFPFLIADNYMNFNLVTPVVTEVIIYMINPFEVLIAGINIAKKMNDSIFERVN